MSDFFKKLKESFVEAYGEKPTTVHGQDSWRTEHYRRQLYHLAKGCFKVECPDEWDKDFILDELLIKGYFVVTDTSVGVVPLRGEVFGNNLWYRPTDVICANHVLGNIERKIGIDCEVVYLNGDFDRRGIMDIINLYAMRMALCDSAWDVNVMNSKASMVFGARDKKEAESIKKAYDEVQEGRPAVFVKTSIIDGMQTEAYAHKAKENFVADLISSEKVHLREEFLTLFGINNANTDKRERLINAEVQSNNEELKATTEFWVSNLQHDCDRVNSMFRDIHLSITMPYRAVEHTMVVQNNGEEEDNVSK